MPTEIMEILKDINIPQLMAMGAMLWFFYSRLDKKIEKLGIRVDGLNDKVSDIDKRLCKVEVKIDDLDKRLCRIEGSLSTQGHCLFNQSKQDKKAE